MAATTCNRGDQRPAGRRTPTAASGTKTPSSSTSWEPVPRMPSARQLSWIVTPGARSGIGDVQHGGALAGIVEIAIVMKRSPPATR